jgi:peptide/nickel transport system ATP-binding protein
VTAPLIEVEDLSVFAGSTVIVDRASFRLAPGSRTGLIGESGSGKTITALAMLGLLPDGLRATGSVKLNGQDLLSRSER